MTTNEKSVKLGEAIKDRVEFRKQRTRKKNNGEETTMYEIFSMSFMLCCVVCCHWI